MIQIITAPKRSPRMEPNGPPLGRKLIPGITKQPHPIMAPRARDIISSSLSSFLNIFKIIPIYGKIPNEIIEILRKESSIKREVWKIHAKKADFDALSQELGVDKVVARILVNRGLMPSEMLSFVRPSKSDFNNPHLLYDMDKSVDIITKSIDNNEKIRVIGDYDIDGICATYILISSLLELGANVDYYLPKRMEDGYGMNESMVDKAIEDGVDLIITCDNGISAHASVEYAVSAGLKVVVTDHHEVPKEDENDKIPRGNAVICPKRADCIYPFKEICGAVVAWKLSQCLYEHYGFDEKYYMEYLEFAAFATVGDIMVLHDENRAIVSLGLKKMAHTKNVGLQMLIECCGLNGRPISAYHVGFVLGPCLNAGGRLADASMGVELFRTKDRDRAYEIAMELKELNEKRKEMTVSGTEEAIKTIEEGGFEDDKVIVVYVPGIHESLCGIIAGRLKEKYTRPCFMLTDSIGYVKGSGRSIPEYPMFEKMSRVSELFLMYGGHPMAAGLSISKDRIPELRSRLNDDCNLCNEDLVKKVMIDVPMPISYITKDLIRQIDNLEPFGNGNEKPLFAQRDVCVWKAQRIRKNSEHLKLVLKDGDTLMEAMYFSRADEFFLRFDIGDHIDILYYPRINEFRGEETLQIIIQDIRETTKTEG